jgi:hypothetical protein
MEQLERAKLLAALHRGATSRNREFERFRDPQAYRVLRAHRMLRSLIGEIQRPDSHVTACWSRDGGTLTLECWRPQLRYRRQVTLSEWEAAFLLQTPAGTTLTALSRAPA